MTVSDLDVVLLQSLTSFTDEVFASGWRGKEREAVSLFAFGHLIKQCRPDSVLFDPAQIGIEVRVLKPADLGVKAEVCKDLVVWNQPGTTCWSKNPWPVAVLEWKANQSQVSSNDVIWLKAFSKGHQDFTGYAICLDLKQRDFRLSCTRVKDGQAQSDWLVL